MAKRRKNTSQKVAVRIEKKSKVSQPTNNVVTGNKADAEKKKLLLMRLGVAGAMAILIVLWIFNLKYQFKINANNNSKNSFSWEQTKAELDKAMNQVKQGINEIKQIQATNQQNTLPREPELTSQQIDLLKGKLMSGAASTVASSTKK